MIKRTMILLCVMSLVALAPAFVDDNEAVLMQYIAAHNNHDIETVMDLVTDDIRFELTGVFVRTGKEEIRALEEWDAAVGGSLDLHGFTLDGDKIVCSVVEHNEWFRLLGFEDVPYKSTEFQFADGKIKSIRAEISSDFMIEFNPRYSSLMTWLNENRKELLPELFANGQFIYTADAAGKWLDVLRDWREIQ